MAASLISRTPVRFAIVLAAAMALLFGLGRVASRPQAPASPGRAPVAGAPQTYAQALQAIDQRLVGHRVLAEVQGGGWLLQDRIANDALARARLTGSFDDYAAAQAALDRGFASAPKGAGPHLTQAVVDFSLHRLARAEAALDAIDHYAVKAEPEIAWEASAMRGDVGFYRGDYAAALRAYGGRQAADESASFRMAVLQSKTGHVDEALAAIDRMERASRFPTAQGLANMALQRGALELQRGNWDRAAAHFARAERLFPGFWLAEAHSAQMLALTGHRAQAIARYEAIAARSDSPEVMDALAGLYRAQGDYPRSRAWADRAGQAWTGRLAQFPEAAYGHAVEHELAFGDPKRALDLALKDHAARPYGMTSIALAWAYLANNRPADALQALAPVQASPWVSAEQHVAAAQAHALLGESGAADAEQQKALAINPRALDPAGALIWFGHS